MKNIRSFLANISLIKILIIKIYYYILLIDKRLYKNKERQFKLNIDIEVYNLK
ncbi:hypothetical protein [Clostridium novyi]|uniref:hypothetical protein n=1 Tax=Clostridium novyi TaxID=1542 RepID=UPI0002FA23C4|nr:hypothetical protein [Clostridium novyi]